MVAENMFIGCYGWRHSAWRGSFYPDDLPEDWQLAYYSNEFNCVLVPAGDWIKNEGFDLGDSLEDSAEGFRVIVECPPSVASDADEFSLFCAQVNELGAHAGGVLLLQSSLASIKDGQLSALPALAPLYCRNITSTIEKLQPVWQPEAPIMSSLAILDRPLTDLKQVRAWLESFVSEQSHGVKTVIYQQPEPIIEQLQQMKTLVEIMGL